MGERKRATIRHAVQMINELHPSGTGNHFTIQSNHRSQDTEFIMSTGTNSYKPLLCQLHIIVQWASTVSFKPQPMVQICCDPSPRWTEPTVLPGGLPITLQIAPPSDVHAGLPLLGSAVPADFATTFPGTHSRLAQRSGAICMVTGGPPGKIVSFIRARDSFTSTQWSLIWKPLLEKMQLNYWEIR